MQIINVIFKAVKESVCVCLRVCLSVCVHIKSKFQCHFSPRQDMNKPKVFNKKIMLGIKI